jgi:anti-sigma regulatory factor (Ser/Thr protein kinase)
MARTEGEPTAARGRRRRSLGFNRGRERTEPLFRMPRNHRYSTVIGADPAEIAEIREDVRGLAVESGFSDRAGDLVLALDELLANAQEHGRPPVEVDAWSDGRLIVEVTDHGEGFDQPRIWRNHPPEPSGRRGRGLWIVRQLVDGVAIASGPMGTRVRVELTVDPAIGA